MSEPLDWLIDRERDCLPGETAGQSTGRSTISHTELPQGESTDRAGRDWNCYRHEASRLLDGGQEGRWVLIHDGAIVGIWDTDEEARAAAAERFLMRPVLIHQIREVEPILRAPTFLSRCRT